MKAVAPLLSVSVMLVSLLAYPALSATPQQDLMKTCNTEAGAQKLGGDARKTFISSCLSGKSSKTLTPQQQKMTACNAQAGSQKLSGDARKKFMSTCLKG